MSLEPNDLVLVNSLAKTFKQLEYYGSDHRLAQGAIDNLIEVFQTAFDHQEELVWEITPSQIMLNQKISKKEDLQASALAEGIYKKGISGFRMVKGLPREALADFITVLSREVLPPQGDAFWNIPGLTVWSLILKDLSAEEEKRETDEATLREFVRRMLSPVAPSHLSREEDILDWAARDEKHLVRAITHLLQDQPSDVSSTGYQAQAKALVSFLQGLTHAYTVLNPDNKSVFLEKIGLAITDIDDWEHIWFCTLDDEETTLFKIYYKLIGPHRGSRIIVQIILSLLSKGSRLVTFLKQCEGELNEHREIMAEVKVDLEKAVQDQLFRFPDLWSMVQGIFLDSEERQFMDDQYLKQLEGFSEILNPIDWKEDPIPADLKLAFDRTHPQEGAVKTVSYLLEFLVSSPDIQDLIYWIRELEGIVQELSLSGDYRQLAMIFQEVSKALASLPFHHDPAFPEVFNAWERLCQVDHTEMVLSAYLTAGLEDRPYLTALLPFLSTKTLTNLLNHLVELQSPNEYQDFLHFLLSGEKKILPPLLSLLKDNPSPPLILRALQIIVHFQAEEVVPSIPDLLSSLSGEDQLRAVKTLSGLKVPEMALILLPYLKKYNDSRRSEVIQALLHTENGQALWMMLKELRGGGRFARYPTLPLEEQVIRALGQARYEPAGPVCRTILMERELFPLEAYRKIKEAAARALREIGTPEATEWLLEGKNSKNKLTRKICRALLGD